MSTPTPTTHPDYASFLDEWEAMRDAYAGERRVKDLGFRYLPPTSAMRADGLKSGQDGLKSYSSYLQRAVFPNYVRDAVRSLVGVMHAKPATIELPDRMEPLRDRATSRGESLGMLLQRINEEQLITGRVGVLGDVISGAGPDVLPYLATYTAENILSWDDGNRQDLGVRALNLVVLDETAFVRTNILTWEQQPQYRVLVLGDPRMNESTGVYRVGVFQDETIDTISDATLIEPSIAGRTLDHIPFVIINTRDLVSTPDNPPLLGLADLCYRIYRGEADFRQALHLQGQDTLVISGTLLDETGAAAEGEVRLGAGSVLKLEAGGTAEYVGVSATGLPAQAEALQADRTEATDLGGKLLDTRGREAESGDALRIRVGARTANLTQIANTGAEGLQTVLRSVAEWIGADPDQVVVKPNLDFVDDLLSGRELTDFMAAKGLGAPLSLRSIHEVLQDRGLTKRDFEAEMAEIETEEPNGIRSGSTTTGFE